MYSRRAMAETRWSLARLEELPTAPDDDGFTWHRVRMHFGISSFGVNAYSADEGTVIEEHDEIGPNAGRHEELYLVLSGQATFTLDGATVDAPTGTFVHVADPSTKRHAVADEPGTVVLVIGGQQGVPFSPSPWEVMAPAFDAYRAKDYATAVAKMRALAGDRPESASMLYNLACMEALAAEREHALEHLERAVKLDASFRELAREDEDFAAIRDEPRFVAAVTPAGAPS